MVGGVEMGVESTSAVRSPAMSTLEIRLLGPLSIRRDGRSVTLPASRKVRALLSFLVLTPRAVTRSRLCDLLWDAPNDPRGELRWCLSKVRGLVDDPARQRLYTSADTVLFDGTDCFVDVIAIERATQGGLESLAPDELRVLAGLVAGDLLDGVSVDRCPVFSGWLAAQRRRFRGCQIALLEQLATSTPDDEALSHVERWLELAPLDPRGHGRLLQVLARRNRLGEGDAHVACASRRFEAEGLDSRLLHETWQAARASGGRVETSRAPATVADVNRQDAPAPQRASIAVMPFIDRSAAASTPGSMADALVHDVITRLAKLRSLFVVAQGSVFALHERRIDPSDAGRMLAVDYCVSGSVRDDGRRLTVTVELAEARTARIVWAETFDHVHDETFLVLDEIGNRIVASVAVEIEAAEISRAVLKPPNSLTAWEAYHCGLWHMYRFSRADNARAQAYFEQALRLDPTFARAHAGLSFTHFQNAFQSWKPAGLEIDAAFRAAGQGLAADDRDPAAHWAMGRALWLRGRLDQSVTELERTIDLSPNFALGHYTLAFVHSQSGDPHVAIAASEQSRQLSPFDPLLFGVYGARAMALVRLGRFDEAAEWGVKAAARPNAHAHILAIAAFSLALAGRTKEAAEQLAALRTVLPAYGVHDFLTAMKLSPDGEQAFRDGARLIGAG